MSGVPSLLSQSAFDWQTRWGKQPQQLPSFPVWSIVVGHSVGLGRELVRLAIANIIRAVE